MRRAFRVARSLAAPVLAFCLASACSSKDSPVTAPPAAGSSGATAEAASACNGTLSNGDALLFSPMIDGVARDDKITAACRVLAGLARAKDCAASQALFGDGSDVIRVFDPWGARGPVDAPSSVVVSMACAAPEDGAEQACAQSLAALYGDPGQTTAPDDGASGDCDDGERVGEAQQGLSPLSILCGLLVVAPLAYACPKSFDSSTCGAATVTWGILCAWF